MPESTLFTAAQYAALASAQVGKPYVLGANGPEKFDCSGLVIWLNNQSGAFPMGDDTAAGLFNRTKAVTGSPAVGDLVFLANNPARSNRIGHAAVLTRKLSNGDWEIIEARGRAYGVVRTTLSYWKTRRYFTGVRRLPQFRLATATTPPPTTSDAVQLRVAELNCLDPNIRQSDGKLHPLTDARKAGIVKAVLSAAADVYLVNECPERTRFVIRDALPGGRARWKVWERGAQAIIFDSQRLAYSTSKRVSFTNYHGGVIAPLADRATGRQLVLGSYHLPPNSLASQAGQKIDVGLFTAAAGQFPGVRIIGGDGMDDTRWAAPLVDVRSGKQADRPTYKGKAITDRIHVDGTVKVRGYGVRDTGRGSDHDLIVTAITIPASVPTT